MRYWCGAMHNVADISGIAKWNSVLREVLVWYIMCDMVRNDGVTWYVVWFGIMSEMVSVWCEMMQCETRYTFHISPPQRNNISHQTTFPAQHTLPHLTSFQITPHFTYFNTTRSHGVMWNSVVWNLVYVQRFAMPDVGCCALFILKWLWCGIRWI